MKKTAFLLVGSLVFGVAVADICPSPDSYTKGENDKFQSYDQGGVKWQAILKTPEAATLDSKLTDVWFTGTDDKKGNILCSYVQNVPNQKSNMVFMNSRNDKNYNIVAETGSDGQSCWNTTMGEEIPLRSCLVGAGGCKCEFNQGD